MHPIYSLGNLIYIEEGIYKYQRREFLAAHTII
jgi:hypothetical protein